MNASRRTGMGSTPFNENGQTGVTFRTWAPFASKVEVIGDFTDWLNNPIELVNEGGGIWSRDIELARVGSQYKFQLTNMHTQEVLIKTDPRGKLIHDNSGWNAEVVDDNFDWGEDHFTAIPWNEMVVYELHIASFNRSEYNRPGNFDALLEKLDHIVDLGFNTILLLPIFGFKGENSWGYNTAFPYDIESAYGNPDIFKTFIKESHRRGIAIILDVVFNHFGSYASHELNQSLTRFDGWKVHDDHDGIYFYHDWRRKTAFGPRPDYGRGQVRTFIRDNVMMWAEEYRVDGFRFDSTVNIRNADGNDGEYNSISDGWNLMQWINEELKRHAPWKISIAEDLQNNEWITKTTEEDGAGFDSQWNSYFFHQIDKNITTSDDTSRNMFEVKDALTYHHGGNLTRNMIYINNHDECGDLNRKFRLPERICFSNADSWYAKKRTALATGLLFTSAGIPMIFQGDEFYEWGTWSDTVEIDWSKKERFSGIVQLHKDLVSLRRNLKGNTRGLQGNNINVFHVNNSDKVIAYHRWYNGGMGDDVIVIANFGNKSYGNYKIGLPNGGLWKVRFNSDWNGYSPDFSNHFSYNTEAFYEDQDNLPFSGNIGLGPYSMIIISQ
ncbi:alpha-amylase family glycosyl hydrolase [Flammeovirga sp. EKP202]|uniref:alpha-amylase family glycosyl hydrolase n=1 Tax=Flammeovirga sp. EKP202 TaxID=2770592 RepID=UPI00165EF344|nr:alpha-amylase family glycosyl hydrolase [Flammeovirga sp. EKP202]MBD0404893.1 alpha amylase C-terminal domain-containing protein [Flammeovirga sp. EKP202]